jgi:PAS domain S-box-containing protein
MLSGTDLFLGLFNNLAIFILLVAVYGVLNARFENSTSTTRRAAIGLCFGLFAIACMHVKIPVAEGVIVDQRNAIVALSGAFGGPLSAALCALMAAAYRAYLGGAGVQGGVFGVGLAAVAGIILHSARSRLDTIPKAAIAALLATFFILPGFLVIGDLRAGWRLMTAMTVPYGSAIFIGILLVGLLLHFEENRHAANVALRESERELRHLYERLIDIAFRTDRDGNVVHMSPSVERIFGYTQDEIAGRPMVEFYRNPDLRDELLAQLLENGKVENFEVEIRRKDGSCVWMSTNAQMLTDEDGVFIGVEGISRDISDLKTAEEEKRRLEESLRQSQKMEAIGTLAGGIAHDFNNILAAVFGYTELVKQHLPEGSQDREHLNQVLAASNRAKQLTRQILTFSRKSKPDKKPVEMHLIVDEAVKLLRTAIPATVIMDVDLDPATGIIVADSTQIHQIVVNLCTNAYHSLVNETGQIRIRLGRVTIDHHQAAVDPGLPEGRYTHLTVTDTGVGMDADTKSRIFEPFFTTKDQGKGTGLGLSVVHGIVADHGGLIRVESDLENGSAFHVYLPLSARIFEDEVGGRFKSEVNGNERILLVDDEEAVVHLGEMILRESGYLVAATTSPMEALEMFRASPRDFDLILTDQTMPKLTGDVLARQAMTIRPEVPVVVCTGYSAVLDAEKSQTIGIRALLMKPFDRTTLLETVRRVLDETAWG